MSEKELNQYINKIIKGNCIDVMKNIPNNSIDVTFADPPFNLNKKYNEYQDNKSLQEYLDWSKKWIKEMVRITKPTGSIFIHNIPKWLTYYTTTLNEIAYFKHWIVWDALSFPVKNALQPAHYGILYYAKDTKKNKFYEIRYPHKRCRKCNYLIKNYGGKIFQLHPFGPVLSDVWTDIHRVRHDKYRENHPCQLPIHLLERIILMSTDENDIILDPFVGTGTSAIAAKRLGRNYIGIDIDKKYVDIANSKLSKELSNSKIGNSWVSNYRNEIITIRNKDWDDISSHFIIPNNLKQIEYTKISLLKGVAK